MQANPNAARSGNPKNVKTALMIALFGIPAAFIPVDSVPEITELN